MKIIHNNQTELATLNIRVFQGFFGSMQISITDDLIFSFFDTQRLKNFAVALKYNYQLRHRFDSEIFQNINTSYEIIYKGKCLDFPTIKEIEIKHKEIPLFYSIQYEIEMFLSNHISLTFDNVLQYQKEFALPIINAYESLDNYYF